MGNPNYHLTKHERAAMIRAHAGLVTALLGKDPDALDGQLKSIVREQSEASRGDVKAFAGRMAKQVEAGAIVTRHLLMSLAPRLDMTEAEAQELLATIYADDSITDQMNE
ncbi:hypothetical protein [Microbacterium oleivorans]|uniref:Uncharacterized protein n=1 Tax=Microbacterium oleivorans TaxID=273677 RepID=A0A031FN44_9MICO|nr:hypothetical protein [Microbacterium oleivorans]EZP26254.1 hypothetical protein BW34_02586 [Microbacterium oleivorans]